jgi:hypothetical protein
MKRSTGLILGLVIAAPAGAQTLYDGSLGTLPAAQGWTAFTVGATQSVSGGGVTLDTTAINTVQAGYSRADTPLNRAAGFTLDFGLRVLSENHVSVDRSGVSLICLASDGKGVELAFWTDEVWAQTDSPLFSHSGTERALYDTTVATAYRLAVTGDSYQLLANGTPLFSGAVKDYSAFAGFPDPYETPNFLFFGDDTTSARGACTLSSVVVNAPETSSLPLFGWGSVAAFLCARPRRPKAHRPARL